MNKDIQSGSESVALKNSPESLKATQEFIAQNPDKVWAKLNLMKNPLDK
ncbi:MAG: hypothetical protein ACD_3C00006G0002 [uncultured bacterium (gcode 4)]|uniref:Uncharacterized protein n=1 Tax=uncultured bacterium (gcode 4) TaxID=1234023 RepID=K2GZ91_9BACT|nr:MAG: hypothetical protein ACD_3C00006G0002 [uncultured bacterium (gcode 4)]